MNGPRSLPNWWGNDTSKQTTFTPPSNHSSGERHVVAARYKTRPCRNFERFGTCPYGQRCMFAHGAEEFRSLKLNIADGLTSEEAIRSFRQLSSSPLSATHRGASVRFSYSPYSYGLVLHPKNPVTPLSSSSDSKSVST